MEYIFIIAFFLIAIVAFAIGWWKEKRELPAEFWEDRQDLSDSIDRILEKEPDNEGFKGLKKWVENLGK